MTRRPRLLALGVAYAAAAAGVAAAQEPDRHAPAAAPAPRAAPARPAPSARPAPAARGGFGGYRMYEHAYPGGVPTRAGAAPAQGDARALAPGQAGAPRPAFGGGFAGRPFDGDRAAPGARFDRDRATPGAPGGAPDRGYNRGPDRGYGYAPGRAPGTAPYVHTPHAIYGGPTNRGFAGPRSGGGQWRYQGRSYARFRATPFRYPRGFGYRAWRRGERFPSVFLYGGYWLNDYADFYLAPPPSPEYRWVRYGPDAVLVDVDTGDVADVAYGVFDDGSAPAADPQWDGQRYDAPSDGDTPSDGEPSGYGDAPSGYDQRPGYGQPSGDGQDGARAYGPGGYDDRDAGGDAPDGYDDDASGGPPPPR